VISAKCTACEGTGEVNAPGRHASRCTACLGSGIAQYSENRQMNAFEP
jgi:DnaJ-class molecular chaperone